MSKVILLLGSNLGNRGNFLHNATELIQLRIGSVLEASSVYESEPWGFESEYSFLNQVIIIETNYQPLTILEKLQKIEKELGRTIKSKSYQNRTIDIDILFYDDIKLKSKKLTIPHPRLHLRKFTMVPLIEVAGEYIHPVFDQRIDSLKWSSDDSSSVKSVENSIISSSFASHEL